MVSIGGDEILSGSTIGGDEIKEITIGGTVAWTATKPIMETGRVYVSTTINGGSIGSVSFTNSYSNPVVVAYMADGAGTQTVGTRVRNLTSSGCEIFMEEPDSEGHAANNLHYVVCETGRWETPEGVTIEAGTHYTTNIRRSGYSDTYGDSISFSSSFPSRPAVLHHLNTRNATSFMGSQANSVSNTGFKTSMEAMDTGKSSSGEDIGWVAIETGSGSLNGNTYEAGYGSDGSNDGIDDTPHTINYSQSYGTTPDVVISGNTMVGIDGYVTQASSTGSSSANVWAMEDQVGDTERVHADETFGWFIIDPDSVVIA